MRIHATAAVAASLLFLTAYPTGAQIVPPAPARTPPTPAYVPPAPPPPPPPPTTPDTPPKPPEPEKPAPSLIQLDSSGKIKPLTLPAEEAAVRALELDEETMKNVEASLAARRAELDRLIVEKIGDLIDVRKAIASATETTGIDVMTTMSKKAQPFAASKLLDRLGKDGALTPAQKSQAMRIARDYRQAVRKEAVDAIGHNNIGAMTLAGFRLQMEEFSDEAVGLLLKQLERAAPRAPELFKGVDLAAKRAEVEKRLADLKKKPPAGTTAEAYGANVLRATFVEVLSPEQMQAFLIAASPELAPAKAPEAPPAGEGGKTDDAPKK